MKRRGFLQQLLFGASATTLLPIETSVAVDTENKTVRPDLTAEIKALLSQTEAIWDSQDTAALRDLWDTDDTEPFYLAGEQDDWFVGWNALNAYLAPPPGVPRLTEAIRVRFYDVRARLLAPDLAFGAYWMRTDMKLVMQKKPFGSDTRVATIFRKKPQGWRYVCYTEAFQSPNIYIQKLYEKNISPEYKDFYDQKMSEQP
jgi:hypothetical protein